MVALTLIQPWAFAVRHLGKPVENREWCDTRLIGQQFCIHAGVLNAKTPAAKWKEIGSAFQSIEAAGIVIPKHTREELIAESGAIVCVATLDRVSERGGNDPIERSLWRGETRYGWVLKNVTSIEPVPCKGAQKLWTVPEDVSALVKERYRAARQQAA